MTERYEPISCDYHDLLEEAAMHKKQIELEFDLDGVQQRERGTIEDVFSREGAEYARFRSSEGQLEIRLDQIISMKEA
jgi:Rho-binding antiterminator